MTALREQELGTLEGAVATPTYDRTRLQAGIIHIGVGGFHRAHQAMYLDELMNAGKAHDWAICGLGLMPGDARMRDALNSQDGLYTLAVKHPDGQVEARGIGSIVHHIHAPADPVAAVQRMCGPDIRIVSLSLTEGGYNVHLVTGQFHFAHPAVRAALEPGATPSPHFGYVIEALRRRRERGTPPF